MAKESKNVSIEVADCYQELFNYFYQEHNVILTVSEMDEIILLAIKTKNKIDNIRKP